MLYRLRLVSVVSAAVALPIVVGSSAVSPADPMFSIESFGGGAAGAAFVAVVVYLGKLLADRLIPSRSDARASLDTLITGLQSMVNTLHTEKEYDSKTLADRQARISLLESEALASYQLRATLQTEIIELQARNAQRERQIQQLVDLLASRYGVTVEGYESDILKFQFSALPAPPQV